MPWGARARCPEGVWRENDLISAWDSTPHSVFAESHDFSCPFPIPRLRLARTNPDQAPSLSSGLSCLFIQDVCVRGCVSKSPDPFTAIPASQGSLSTSALGNVGFRFFSLCLSVSPSLLLRLSRSLHRPLFFFQTCVPAFCCSLNCFAPTPPHKQPTFPVRPASRAPAHLPVSQSWMQSPELKEILMDSTQERVAL